MNLINDENTNTHKYSDIIEFLNSYEQVDYKKIKIKMREIRKSKGITPVYFEKQNLLSVGTVKQLEKLSYPFKPSLESLIKFCHGLDIDIRELLK